jgi:hypothetical protein
VGSIGLGCWAIGGPFSRSNDGELEPWSTDDPERGRIFGSGEHCAAIEHRFNIMFDAQEMPPPSERGSGHAAAAPPVGARRRDHR